MGAILGSLQLNGQTIARETPGVLMDSDSSGLSKETRTEICRFLEEWWNPGKFIEVSTSGSTGRPKRIRLSKEMIAASADRTIQFFGLKPGQSALLCLSCTHIAGKLMIVRAIRGKLRLIAVEPQMNPLTAVGSPLDFAAMIPSQVVEGLKNSETRKKFISIGQVLIGGAPIEPDLEGQLGALPNRIFHSYGMTETATHVALREIGESRNYTALPGFEFSTDDRGCLEIASNLHSKKLVTNDLVELIGPKTFHWLGRADNAIISGGVKYIPELIEQKISSLIGQPFYVSGAPDEKLGEHIVLHIEGPPWSADQRDSLIKKLKHVLGRYEVPRKLEFHNAFQRTGTGKIIR